MSEAEAELNIADTIRECLAVRAELGMAVEASTRGITVSV